MKHELTDKDVDNRWVLHHLFRSNNDGSSITVVSGVEVALMISKIIINTKTQLRSGGDGSWNVSDICNVFSAFCVCDIWNNLRHIPTNIILINMVEITLFKATSYMYKSVH